MNDTHAVRAGWLIDGGGGPPQRDVLLRIKDGIITAITPYGPNREIDALPITDLSYAVLCPPFIDCHVHLVMSGTTDLQFRRRLAESSHSDLRPVIRRHIDDLFAHGVLAVRDAGDRPGLLQRYAEEQGVNMIVMSTRGRSGFSRWLLGSVADRVVRGATVPVLLVQCEPACKE